METLLYAGLLLVILVVLAKHVNSKRARYRTRRNPQPRVPVMARVSIVLGYTICGSGYLWTLWLLAAFVSTLWGVVGIVICIVLAPVAVFALPLYAGFRFDNWLPLVIGLGSIIVGLFAEMIRDDLVWTE